MKKVGRYVKGGESVEVSAYDKIFREVSPHFLSVLIDQVLKLDIVEFEELKDKLQVTRQTETDTLRRVTDRKGNTYILHIEIESRNDPTMALRMADYFTTLYLIYKLPVKQFVIYIGDEPCRMPERLDLPGLRFDYKLIVLSAIPYRMFLDSDRPEVQVLALLGDLEGRPIESVTQEIFRVIVEVATANSDKRRRMKQLRMLAQLRNFDFNKVEEDFMFSIAEIFKEERDPFFKRGLRLGEERGIEQGIEKGMEKGMAQIIRKLILNTGSSDAEIARDTDVPVGVIREIRASIKD